MKRVAKLFVSSAMTMVVAGVGALALPATVQAQQISVAGSTTVKPIVDVAVKEFNKTHSDAKFVVGAGGSGQGIQAIGKGNVQIGMSSRPMKDEEKAMFSGVVATQIGTDGVALLVHNNNPVKSITAQQVVDVFTGKITNWKELGGNNAPIVLVTPNSKHGTFDAFIEHFKLEGKAQGDGIAFNLKGKNGSGPVAMAVDGSKPVLAAMMTQPNAISYVSLGSALAMAAKGAPIHMLDLNNVAATEANVLSGSYSLQRPLLLLTNGNPGGVVKEFVTFTCGTEGQQIVKSLDYIPLQK